MARGDPPLRLPSPAMPAYMGAILQQQYNLIQYIAQQGILGLPAQIVAAIRPAQCPYCRSQTTNDPSCPNCGAPR